MRAVKPSHILIIGLLISAFTLSIRFFAHQKVVASISDSRLVEVSGIDESYTNPGYFWTHNDSDSDPIIYLIDKEGNIHMEVTLEGIENRDWEEIVTVNNGEQSFIYVAETGDNRAVHESVSLIQLEEPIFNSATSNVPREKLKIMQFKYAEGARDAEAVLYDYQKQEFVLVTKREKHAMVYSFPFEINPTPMVIKAKGTVPSRNFTAADMNEKGELLLKHYDSIFYWGQSSKPAVDRILDWNPRTIDYTPEPQGEAICWHSGSFYTISEKNIGKPQEMLYFQRLR